MTSFVADFAWYQDKNNHKLVKNTPDFPKLGVLKCHSVHDVTFLWLFVSFSDVFLLFLTILVSSLPVWYVCPWFVTDGGQIRNQQEKLHQQIPYKKILQKHIWYFKIDPILTE